MWRVRHTTYHSKKKKKERKKKEKKDGFMGSKPINESS